MVLESYSCPILDFSPPLKYSENSKETWTFSSTKNWLLPCQSQEELPLPGGEMKLWEAKKSGWFHSVSATVSLSLKHKSFTGCEKLSKAVATLSLSASPWLCPIITFTFSLCKVVGVGVKGQGVKITSGKIWSHCFLVIIFEKKEP